MSPRGQDGPHYRAIFAVDIENSTARNNTVKAGLRDAMYEIVERSLVDAGITTDYRDPLVDRGDGILALVRPVEEVPKTVLLSAVVPTLAELLADYDATRHPEQRLRLRAVLHAGEVHQDVRGPFGEALDIAFRLLDAPEVKQAFRMSIGPLLLVVSDDIYRTIVRHGYDGIDEQSFRPMTDVLVNEQHHRGWVCLPSPRTATDTPPLSDVYVPAAARRMAKDAHRFDVRPHAVLAGDRADVDREVGGQQ